MADGWTLKTPSGSVRAGKVLIATNAYGGSSIRHVQRTYFPLKVFPDRDRSRCRAKYAARLFPGGQGVGDTRRNLFTFRFDADNRLISGGMHILGAGADTRVPQTIWRAGETSRSARLPPLAYAGREWRRSNRISCRTSSISGLG